MTYEEKENLEYELKYALDNIVSKIKDVTATEILVSEQSMILLFQKLMNKIEVQSIRIQKLKEDSCCMTNCVRRDKEKLFLEDKIKAKIEPKLKELDKQINEEWKKYGNSKELQDMEDIYNFLQSL